MEPWKTAKVDGHAYGIGMRYMSLDFGIFSTHKTNSRIEHKMATCTQNERS